MAMATPPSRANELAPIAATPLTTTVEVDEAAAVRVEEVPMTKVVWVASVV
jgi:hypothetical protein